MLRIINQFIQLMNIVQYPGRLQSVTEPHETENIESIHCGQQVHSDHDPIYKTRNVCYESIHEIFL